MAVVGDAYIVVRALTNRVRPEIERAFSGLDDIGRKAGQDISDAMNDSLGRGASGGGGGGLGRVLGSKFEKDAEKARVKLRQLTQAGFFAGPAFSALGGIIGSLGAGLVTLGAAAGAAAGAGVLVLAGAFTALIQSAITLKLALSGVAAAVSAGNKAASGSAAQTKAIEAANNRLKKAQLALFRVEQDRIDQIKDIKRANEDAQRSAIDSIISARRSERSYEAAQRNTKKVIEDVTKAREEAIEKLQQLRFETEGGAISEKRARLEFEKTRDSLQRVQDLPPNSRARQEAELAFAEADLNLRKAIDRNKDLKSEEKKKTVEVAKLRATDIMKTQEVVDAVQEEADARIDASRAASDALRAQQAAQESANDIDSGKAFRDINRALADANEAVKEAKKDLNEAKGGGGAADAFADALSKLSPEAQKFVKFLVSLRGEFDKLKASAGRELFPRLEIALQNLVDNLFPVLNPLLEGTGKALGDVAINLSKVITDADNLKSLENVWKTNDKFIGNLGTAVGNLYTGFLNILEAAGPLITRFGEWLAVVTGTWAETQKLNNQNGTLTKRFNRLGDITADIGGYLKTFFSGLKDIFAVITEEGGAVDILNGYFKTAAERFKDFTSAGREDGSLKEFFNRATENFTKVLSLIGNIVAELLKLGDNAGVGQFTDSLNRAVDTFGRIGEKLTGKDGAASGLGTFIEKFALLSEKLTDSGSIEMFFKVLNTALDVANKIFGNELVQNALKVIGVVIGLSKGIGLVIRSVKFIGQAIAGTFLKIGKFMTTNPFLGLIRGSTGARTELQKQMIIDKQKQMAMKGVQISADQAARAIGLVAPASAKTRVQMKLGAVAAKTKSIALRGLGAAGRVAGAGLRFAGKGLALLGGPLGLIFLVLPLIIENWDKIVAFFKDLIPKLGKIFGDMWAGLTSFLGEAWTNISTWFTQTFLPGLGKFFLMALKVIGFILFPLPSLIIAFWPQIVKFFTEVLLPWFAALPGKIAELAGKIWNFLKDSAVTAWNGLVSWFTIVFTFYRELPGKILNIAGKVWNFLSDGVKTAWTAVTGYVTGTLIPWVMGFPGRVAKGAGRIWGFLSDGISIAWKAVTGYITNTLIPGVMGLPGRMANALKGLWNGLLGGVQAAWANVKAWWNNNVASKKLVIGGFKVLGVQIPRVELGFPRLAEGGIIPATPGGTMAMIGEAGRSERVEPLDPNGLSKRDKAMIDYMGGGAGTTINVYPSAGMNERELADLVSRKLAQTMRRGAA